MPHYFVPSDTFLIDDSDTDRNFLENNRALFFIGDRVLYRGMMSRILDIKRNDGITGESGEHAVSFRYHITGVANLVDESELEIVKAK